jgi:phage-related minor tail protein
LRVSQLTYTIRIYFFKENKKSNTADVIVNEVQKFVGQVVNESGKVVNKENCQKILNSVTSKFKDKESQQKFCDTLKKVGSTIQSVVNEVVGEVEKEVSKALPAMKKVAEDVSQKVKEEIKAVREDDALGKILNEVSKSIESEMKKDEDWTVVEQSKSEPVKIEIKVENPKTQATSEEKKVEEKKEQPKEELKPVPHELLASRFIKDISVEDNAEIVCGTQFDKVWRIQNSGNVKWPEGVCLEYLGGSEEMGMFLIF